jgi:cation:H+ antiporter
MALVIVSGMILIVLSADYFTNGVEWLGRALHLNASAVGTLMAALGTALPETLVPVMALLSGAAGAAGQVGLGAILGAPFMLATLGFLVLGSSLWWFGRHDHRVTADPAAVTRDLSFFLVVFGAALAATWIPATVRPYWAAGLVIAYALFARAVIRSGRTTEDAVPEAHLHLWHRSPPPLSVVGLQVAMALVGLVVGAHYFVAALEEWARASGWSGFLLSVILTPVATELPEVLNSVIWIRRGADTLAFGNVTGAMAFQASLVPALGIWLTPWHLDPLEGVVGLLGLVAALFVLLSVRRRGLAPAQLLGAGAFYFLFVGVAVAGVR